MKLDTRGYSGRVSKSATIYTNDPKAKSRLISLEASIRSLITLSPATVFLHGQAGEVVKATVEVRAEKDAPPLRLEPSQFDLGEKVTYSLEEAETGKMYRVHLENAPGLSGVSYGQLVFKTNYPEKPVISILIRYQFGS